MSHMFNFCISLISLDLSNFDTSQVTDMSSMFSSCFSLISLDLSNFDTSLVTDKKYMFSSCSTLTSLDLTNFNTSLVTDMKFMFGDCSSLTSLDLSNIDTSLFANMSSMFDHCINLEYINLKNFNESKLNYSNDIFYNIPENIVICINEKEKIFSQIINKSCQAIDCSDVLKSKQKKIINNTNECIDSCGYSPQYKYEYNGKCYENCRNGFFQDNHTLLNICKCELDKCLTCPQVTLRKNLCTKCNDKYYPKENDPLNIGIFINCYNQSETKGYYLDSNLYKKCYNTCRICEIKGDNFIHNCIECNDNFSLRIKRGNYFNCYENYKNCSFYYYFDDENNFHCTLNYICPEEYPQLLENQMEYKEYDIEDIIDLIKKLKNVTENVKDKEIKYYNILIKTIEKKFTSVNYNTFNLDKGQDDIIITEKIKTTLTTYKNQKNNLNNNTTKIDLGECETLLRNYYNISINETLYIKKFDIIKEEMNTLKVEFDLYAKLFGNNLIKLNLTICKIVK